ncbi:MAG TPA: LPXTG cell wall anchor domain-containing protein [Thermoanaerobaculia bacterium]
MPKPLRITLLVLALGVSAGLALAQNADKNTAGPTANTLQLKLVEPVEGASITGTQVRVGLAYNMAAFGQGQGTKFGEANFPLPIFEVYLDNDLKATLKGTEANVTFIENVNPGKHKLAVLAKNISGEVIDRKEVNIVTVPAVAAVQEKTTLVEERPAPPPPPAPVIEAPAPPPPPAPMEREALPKTGSAYPTLALAGFALVAVGLSLARKVS